MTAALRTFLRHRTPRYRRQVAVYAKVFGRSDAEMRPYVDGFVAAGWSPTLVNVICNFSGLPTPARVLDLANRFSGDAFDAWMPYLILCRVKGLHPALPHVTEPDWSDGALAPSWPVQRLISNPTWVAELVEWFDAAGRLAPLALATGLTLDEARTQTAAGHLTEEGLRTMLALVDPTWEPGVPWEKAAL